MKQKARVSGSWYLFMLDVLKVFDYSIGDDIERFWIWILLVWYFLVDLLWLCLVKSHVFQWIHLNQHKHLWVGALNDLVESIGICWLKCFECNQWFHWKFPSLGYRFYVIMIFILLYNFKKGVKFWILLVEIICLIRYCMPLCIELFLQVSMTVII